MSVFETFSPTKPSAEEGARRLKRTLAQAFQQVEFALEQVRRITERHGAASIQSALGDDRTEVERLYKVLRSLVEQNKPGTTIPDMVLPST